MEVKGVEQSMKVCGQKRWIVDAGSQGVRLESLESYRYTSHFDF